MIADCLMTSREARALRLQGEDPLELREWTYDRAKAVAVSNAR